MGNSASFLHPPCPVSSPTSVSWQLLHTQQGEGTVSRVEFTVHSVMCTVCRVQYTSFSVHFRLYRDGCARDNIECTVYTVHGTGLLAKSSVSQQVVG